MAPGRPSLIGLPYDAASSFLRGAAAAPAAIRAALLSPAGNSFSEDLHDLRALADAGDVVFGDDIEPRDAIARAIASCCAAGERPIALGGDHSVTHPVMRAVHAAHGAVSVLHIDAHPDLYDVFEGDRYSHACPFARIMEEGLAQRLVQVGIRTMTPHLREQAGRFGVHVIDMRAWVAGERPVVEGPVYLSIDLDGIDPAFVPGVSHPEPGGLTVRDVITMVQQLTTPTVRLVGADVVELNPSRDPSGVSAIVAAKLVKEIAAAMLVPPA